MNWDINNLLELSGVVITVIGSWFVARYTAKMDNKKNLQSMKAEMDKLNTANKYENRRIVNQLILEKGAELSVLISEMMKDEINVGIVEVYGYYRASSPEQKQKTRDKALERLRESGNIAAIKQRRCSVLFSYFPDLKKDFKDLMGKYNVFKILELYYQENKLRGLDNEYSERAMSGEDYTSTIDSYNREFYELIDKLDKALTNITIEMKSI